MKIIQHYMYILFYRYDSPHNKDVVKALITEMSAVFEENDEQVTRGIVLLYSCVYIAAAA